MKAAHLILATVLVLASLVRPASADFLAGWQALADGRYEDARDAWVERAKGGDVDLQYYLGLLHDSGMLGGVDLEAATSWYSAAADRKLPAALHRLAHHALNGTEPDPRLAIELLTRAANLGYVRSLQSLATIYERGVHGAPQPDLASYWYHLAALQGLAEAQYGLARLSALDIGNDNSHEQALVWYRRAAEAGLAEAQNNLAYMFEQGLGVARDFEAAVTWYRRAADQGLAVAQNNLGIMLQYGRGTKVDPIGARMNYEAAARAGHPLGQINFATFLANGIGTEKLLPEAYAWLVVARRSDDENARAMATEFIASLGHRLDHESLRRASIRATGLVRTAGSPVIEAFHLPMPGALGSPVVAVQRYLVLLGYLHGAVDNIAGPITRAAIQAFQRRAGIEADGLVSETLVTLLGKSAIGLILASHGNADRARH